MKITITQGPFLPVPPILGGAVEKAWFALGQAFAARGHDVVHLSRAHAELSASGVINGVRHERLSGFTARSSFAARNLCDLWYGLRLLPRLPPADILVTNSFWLPILTRRRSRGIPYAHVARFPKGQIRLYKRAALQTVSAPIRDAIIAEDPRSADRIRVIPYPITQKYLLPGDAPQPAENTILYAGRIHPEKGIQILIDAFGRLPNWLRDQWRLKIVGPWETSQGGGGKAHLNALRHAAARISDRVEFTGPVFAEQKLVAHYRTARVFVYPSLAERGETFGLAALEAMASGCAPVVSSLACFQDFIRPEANGLVFDHRTADPAGALAQTLTALLPDSERIEMLRHSALATAHDYTLDKIADQFLEDFRGLLADEEGLPRVTTQRAQRSAIR